ncbi:hypothetical protein SAMN04488120_101138 [Fontimonas thermophila]|uniref:Uncharacterized protein n=2 Tax=Fontimonas thermophila TaxID=1076937 RepID=A0A1I2H2G7_9GAMM|nr:hypothetical protein SAMN04488120_101138 [Fontimonas thermophila]
MAANDGCARIPLRRPQPGYRRLFLRTDGARRTAVAWLITAAFCGWWVALRPASATEIDAVRQRLDADAGAAALARFDARLAGGGQPSLLRLHLLRNAALRDQPAIAASAAESSG